MSGSDSASATCSGPAVARVSLSTLERVYAALCVGAAAVAPDDREAHLLLAGEVAHLAQMAREAALPF